jgi:hypothetical protein
MKIIKKYIPTLKKDVEYIVGEIPQDNFDMIDKSHGDDIWFNVQGFSVGNVVVRIYGMNLDKKQLRQIILQGAILCKQQSKYYFMSNLVVLYNSVNKLVKTESIGIVISKDSKIKII